MSSLMKLYADEVERRLTELSAMDITSEKYIEGADAVNSLMDRYIKLQDQEHEYQKNCNDEEKVTVEKQKVNNDRLIQMLKIGTTVGIAVFYAGVQIWTVKDNQVYETVGCGMHTTEPGRSGLKNLLNLFGKVKMS